jgi:flagellar motor switch protein FliN/FliY
MNSLESNTMDHLLSALQEEGAIPAPEETVDAPAAPKRDLLHMMRKIPVKLTLEVGSANISLEDLLAIEQNSVIELDALAGDPLTIKVNGTPIGRAEVVVAGENYGLRVVEISCLDLETLGR